VCESLELQGQLSLTRLLAEHSRLEQLGQQPRHSPAHCSCMDAVARAV